MIKVVPLMDRREQLHVTWGQYGRNEHVIIGAEPKTGFVTMDNNVKMNRTGVEEVQRALALAEDIAAGRIEIARDF